jgi:hypothetical protein
MMTKRRWLKSAILAAQQPTPALPWERKRKAPAISAPPAKPAPQSMAAR